MAINPTNLLPSTRSTTVVDTHCSVCVCVCVSGVCACDIHCKQVQLLSCPKIKTGIPECIGHTETLVIDTGSLGEGGGAGRQRI